MNADTSTMLCREGNVEANDNFQHQFSPSYKFQNVVWKVVDSACGLVRKTSFGSTGIFCIADAAFFALSLSHVPWWRASFSAHFTSMFFVMAQQKSDPLVQTSLLRVGGCCCINVHVSTSFCCCETQPMVLGDEKRFFLPRECFFLYCKTVDDEDLLEILTKLVGEEIVGE